MNWRSCPTSPIPPPPPPTEPYPSSSSGSLNLRPSSSKTKKVKCETDSQSPENKLKERKRKRRSSSISDDTNSSAEEDLEKPRTLGELVAQTSKKIVPRSTIKQTKPDRVEEEPKPKNCDELPALSEEDLKVPIIMNPDIPFDPYTMKIYSRAMSAKPMENGYLQADGCIYSSNAERNILKKFEKNVISFINNKRNSQPVCRMLTPPPTHASCKCGREENGDYLSETSSSSSSSDDELDDSDVSVKRSTKRRNREALLREIARKQNHPAALHPDLVFNEPGMTNDGPACRCPPKSRSEGIRHQIFVGEEAIPLCNPHSNNSTQLYHYVLQVNSSINNQHMKITSIKLGDNVFTLRGFSIFFHRPLPEMFPRTPVSRWTTEIEFEFVEEPMPECFTIGELEAFSKYMLENVLEFYDFPRFPPVRDGEETCPIYHFMPRFVGYYRGAQTILPMSVVLDYLEKQFTPFLSPADVRQKLSLPEEHWQNYCNDTRNVLLLNPNKRPSTLRVDGLERPNQKYPQLVHSTSRCPAYLSVQQAQQQTLQKKLHKKKKLLKMKKTPSSEEYREINQLQKSIEELKLINASLRCLKVTVSLENYLKTGFNADIISQVLTMSLACFHARLHISYDRLESRLGYKFSNRGLLELALTHPSFKQNYGMIADHARNALLTCGYKRQFRYEKYEDYKKMGGGPRMCQFIKSPGLKVKAIQVIHNERLEYLGDAVVEMLATHRLFFLLPHHQEGPLATYRSSIVQNRNLSSLSLKLGLDHYLLFTHGPDLCHDGDFRHALANAFEAIMGAIYLDSGLEEADRIFTEAMYGDDPQAKSRWLNLNCHELQKDNPEGDRHLIETIPTLKKVTQLEEYIGYKFKHIRLLAKALTRRCIPYNEVTKGHNQRLEWLGDTVLQLIVSDYLYRHFPHHNEGHLSLLRTCIVSNKTQAQICDELCLQNFCIRPHRNSDSQILKLKDKADLVEALLGALFVDGGWKFCQTFVRITFLPRLKYFLVQKRWSDEKSQLQHACLALRSHKSKRAECPHYRMLSQSGPTNSRTYTVGVFFRAKKLAEGTASNLHAAEMEAARNGLEAIRHLLEENEEVKHPRQNSPAQPVPSIPQIPSSSYKGLPSLMSYVPTPQPAQPVYYQQPPPYHYYPVTAQFPPPQVPQPLMRIYYPNQM